MFKRLSLPTRLALAATVAMAATTILADVMAVTSLRRNLSASVASSLSGMVKRAAERLDGDLEALAGLLVEQAEEMAGTTTPEREKALWRSASALRFAFDYGVILVDDSGKVVADNLRRDEWDGIDMADQEFFQRAFALGGAIVSEPFRSPRDDGKAIVVIAVPVADAEGKLSAILAGGMDCAENRTLNQPTAVRSGRFGQIGLFTTNGVVVAHSQKELLLHQYENPYDDALDNPENGVSEIVASDGTPTIVAVAPLAMADWILAGAFASPEVYRPIDRGFAAAHWWFAIGIAACSLLVWLITVASVRDVEKLSREIESIEDDALARGQAAVGEAYRDEAGTMARAVNNMLASLARARREIGDLSYRLAGAQERERRAIAADLHDSVSQSLALANMKLGGLKKKLGPAEAEAAAQVQKLLEDSVGELRTLTFNLSPNILYELGLAPALEWHGEAFAKKYGVPVEVTGSDALADLDEGIAIFLYRAAGELMVNAAKHASPSRIKVEVYRDGGAVHLKVEDDGVGMSPDVSLASGFGLRHLHERVRQLHGQLVFSAAEPKGTAAHVEIPVSP